MDKQNFSGLNFVPPKNLITAMSEIQQWHVYESSGQPLGKDFFTMQHTMAFATIAVRSAFLDTFIWILGYLVLGALIYFVQENFLHERTTQILFWKVDGSPVYWFAKLASFGGLAFSTVMCVLMSRYYIGMVPRKAINSLFATRAIFLMSASFAVFLILGLLYRFLSDDMYILKASEFFLRFSESAALKFEHYVHYYLRRAVFEASIISIVASSVSVVIPFVAIGIYKAFKRRKQDLGVEVE